MKFIKFTYYNTKWSSDLKTFLVCSNAKEVFVNVKFIATISPKPIQGHANPGEVDLYYVKTAIPNGRGINGVDYSSYYVTEETYHTLISQLEIAS